MQAGWVVFIHCTSVIRTRAWAGSVHSTEGTYRYTTQLRNVHGQVTSHLWLASRLNEASTWHCSWGNNGCLLVVCLCKAWAIRDTRTPLMTQAALLFWKSNDVPVVRRVWPPRSKLSLTDVKPRWAADGESCCLARVRRLRRIHTPWSEAMLSITVTAIRVCTSKIIRTDNRYATRLLSYDLKTTA